MTAQGTRVLLMLGALLFLAVSMWLLLFWDKGESGGCDELLDRLVEAKEDYQRSDSSLAFNKWWVAAGNYCEECIDPWLCDGDRPK